MDCYRLLKYFTAALCIFSAVGNAFEKVVFSLPNEPVDVIIPCCEKDKEILPYCIGGIKAHIKNIRRIIIVSNQRLTEEAEWFDEKLYPFSIRDVAGELLKDDKKVQEYLDNKRWPGWYFQQLLKLYAPIVIPELSSNILVVDSDTIFINPVTFLDEDHGGLFAWGSEYNLPYFQQMDKLLPGLKRVDQNRSGICHHMLFQKPILLDLLSLIEEHHQVEAWRAFCRCVDRKYLYGPGASEYEIYYNFAQLRTDQVKLRELYWSDVSDLKRLSVYVAKGFHFVSCHSWSRRSIH